jgi:hypothetical protein
MHNWFLNLSEDVERVATDAVVFAQKHSGQWLSPLSPHLGSCVRYIKAPEQMHQALMEIKKNPEEVSQFIRVCPHGFFQVYLPHYYRPDLCAPVYQPERDPSVIYQSVAEAVSGLKNTWYEEVCARGYSPSSFGGLIHLIEQMGCTEKNKMKIIKSHRCFIKLSPIPGFKKFVSADRRFPVSISYPQELVFSLDFNVGRNINIRWNNELAITRENFGMTAQSGNREASRRARMVLQGKKEISQFMLEDFALRDAWALKQEMRNYPRKPWLEDRIIGERVRPIEAKRLVWLTPSGQYGGEWVFFLRARLEGTWPNYTTNLFNPRAQLPELWTIYNSANYDASVDESVFSTLLSSLLLLPPRFFCSFHTRY